MTTVDLNADLGESFGTWTKGLDLELLRIVTSANVACGFHAGDPLVMKNSCASCMENNVNIGAHPGFRDLAGFGRREIQGYGNDVLHAEAIYQIGALQAIATSLGTRVGHVKFHGAVANMASRDIDLSRTLYQAVRALDAGMRIIVIASTRQQDAAEELGMNFVTEIFADRAYNDDGTLVSRLGNGAMIRNPDTCADNMLRAVETGAIISINGNRVSIDPGTICVHGDTPDAVRIAEAVRNRLEQSGVGVAGFTNRGD